MPLTTYTVPTKKLNINGKEITIQPLVLRQIPEFKNNCMLFINALNDFDALINNLPALISAVAVSCDIDKQFLEELDLATFLEIINNILEVNSDFLESRMMPLLTDLTKIIQKLTTQVMTMSGT